MSTLCLILLNMFIYINYITFTFFLKYLKIIKTDSKKNIPTMKYLECPAFPLPSSDFVVFNITFTFRLHFINRRKNRVYIKSDSKLYLLLFNPCFLRFPYLRPGEWESDYLRALRALVGLVRYVRRALVCYVGLVPSCVTCLRGSEKKVRGSPKKIRGSPKKIRGSQKKLRAS